MLQNQGLMQRLKKSSSAPPWRRTLQRSFITAACVCAAVLPLAQAADTAPASTSVQLIAETPVSTATDIPSSPPSGPQTPNPSEPTPTWTETGPAGSATQAPATVTQPPGLSGYVPVDYLLIFFGAALIAFLATRPGTQDAIKALLKLLTGSGPGNPPV